MAAAAVLDLSVPASPTAASGKGRATAGSKRKTRGGAVKQSKSIPDESEMLDPVLTNGSEQCQAKIENAAEREVPRKMPRRAAARSNLKEKSLRLSQKTSMVESKKDHVEEEESEAVRLTQLGPEGQPPCRKLIDFILHDSDGNPQPFEMSEIDDTFITSLIMPMDDDLEKEKQRGVRCEGFGRIESWSISGYDEGTPIIWVSTELADYECVKPAGNYKKYYERFLGKAQVCIEIFKKLVRSQGGNPNLTLEELLASVARSMNGSKSFPVGSSGMEFLISLGEFIYNQLVGLDGTSGDDVQFATLPVLASLREQSRNRVETSKLVPATSGTSLKIGESKQTKFNEDEGEDEDEKLARLLQEEEDWKLMKQQHNRRTQGPGNKFYIKINEDEIANDYPLPAYYKPTVQEMDEFIFFEMDNAVYDADMLPKRILDNWSLYNSESRLISLELLPMKPCAETDITIFGSGSMREDDGSGWFLENDYCQSSSTSGPVDADGVSIYLSAIKEWMIEFGGDMISVSIRTDLAWYRLGKPTKHYSPWYEPVLKTARLARGIISLLKGQSRASKLSFADVIKKVAEFEKNHPAYTSSNVAAVERHVVVHGQIILQQFAEYPDEMIRKSAFVTGLADKMEKRHHTKLVVKKKAVVQNEGNRNPSASMVPLQSKRKVMRATMTRLIDRIWGDYYSSDLPDDCKEGCNDEPKEEEEIEEQEENEEEDAENDENASVIEDAPKTRLSLKAHNAKSCGNEMVWEGVSSGKLNTGDVLYKSARVRGSVIAVGRTVTVESDESEMPAMLFVEYMFEKHNGIKMVHGRVLLRGSQTVLGNAANGREVFLTNECMEFELADVKDSVVVDIRKISWGHNFRKEYAQANEVEQAKAEERKRKGLSMEFFCKSLYWPQRGAFFSLPHDTMGLGTGICHSCNTKNDDKDKFEVDCIKSTFLYKKIEYQVHDFVYIRSEPFGQLKEDCETYKGGRNVGLKAFVVCQLLGIEEPKGSKQTSPKTTLVKVRRFYRPEDISAEKAYRCDIREIYYSEEICSVPVETIEGKCEVRKKNELPSSDVPVIADHIFYCERSYEPANGAVKQLPAAMKFFSTAGKKVKETTTKNCKGKGKCKEGEKDEWKDVPKEERLSTLDIFAGCGGLSEGLQQSGASYTKWAIEYEQPAGEAFQLNHPEALMFIDNCNVILRAIMEKCGDADDCIATAEATELAGKLDEQKLKDLPVPGQVDFINGGPPCQGFSGMNRFSHSTWSKVQCEMILAFLSFADYFRPRFFLLENVRTFVSFNKGQTFRLTLASLLEMGYQVRFGILEAGAYGVSQSRKRAFIWAACPEEILPEWPEPMHVFASPELKVSLPGGMHYAAVSSTAGGAPFRSITVKDTIGDLPPVLNGASKQDIEYGSEPVSWFQKQIRRNMMVLTDHISKEMNELNLIRCQHIPCRPGADWRDLPQKKVKLSDGDMVDLIPWCLPNTAKRHNQWKGLFGRLDWEGNFPTSITDPQPMGKVGMCFHPEQDRILTVRECARSQGFPDGYHFSGNIQSKHRQIGNAVPPPLAYALGRKLKEAVDAKKLA